MKPRPANPTRPAAERSRDQNAPARGPSRQLNWILAAALAIVTFVLFAPVMSHEFVDYDDADYVFHNDIVKRGLTADGFAWACKTTAVAYWHPLTWMSHMLDCEMFELRAGGHHATSLVIHVATIVLLFLLLTKLTGAAWRSFVVAALFAVHPMHVESVAWIAERKDVLSGFFFLLALWAYGNYGLRKKGDEWQKGAKASETRRAPLLCYGLALLFFAFAIMCKPMVVTLPCVLLLVDLWPLKRVTFNGWRAVGVNGTTISQLLLEKIPFFALSAGLSVITYSAGKLQNTEDLLFHRRLDNAAVSYIRYLAKLVWPTNMVVFYPFPDGWPQWQVIGAALLLIAVTVAVLLRIRTQPWLAVGWFWFVGMLVPVIGIVQSGIQAMADRYSYLPSIGFFLAATWLVAEFVPHRSRAAKLSLALVATTVLIALSIVTHTQLAYWKNSRALFEHAVKVTDKNILAHVTLSKVLREQNDLAGAQEHIKAAVDILVDHYSAAVHDAPDNPKLHQALGNALAKQGRLDSACEHFAAASKLAPASAEMHFDWAMALAQSGKMDDAENQFKEALRLKPDFGEARKQLELLERGR